MSEDPRPGKKPKPARRPLRVVPEHERDQRVEIVLSPEVHKTTAAMCRALTADPELYQRGGSLAHVIRADEDDERSTGIVPGSPLARAAPLSWLIDRVSEFATCKRVSKKGNAVDVEPPVARVRAVLERGEWRGIRSLNGIIEAPSMRPDGTVIQEPGHDRATGYLYEPNADFLPVDDRPSNSDCVAAFARLAEPFRDFPYVSPAHLSAVIAAVLTLLARPAIEGACPCFLFDASAPRSGKSLQVDVIHLIATGRPASRMTYPEQDEELEKVLAGYAMRGATSVPFDNVARPFGGAALDKIITAVDRVDLRVLGASDLVTFPWRAVVFASGNNVTCRGDMLQRVLSPRLESPLENPEARADLKYPDLRAWVRENRPRLVHAALTLLRGYVAAGRPDQGCARWGGFESWSRLIPHALKWVGAEDPLAARRGLAGDDDPERVTMRGLVEGWARMCNRAGKLREGMTAREAIALLFPPHSHRDPQEPPDGNDELRDAIEDVTRTKPGATPGSVKLGNALRRYKNRPVGARRLVVVDGPSSNIVRWSVVSS